jgi:hypothetical protein
MGKIITPAGAGNVLTEDQLRAEECNAAVQEILKRYKCFIVPFVHIEGGQMQQGVQIRPAPKVDPAALAAAGEMQNPLAKKGKAE